MSLVGADSATYVSGLQVRTKYNADLLNIVQKFKQGTAPTDTEPLMWWFDTTTSILKLRNEADDAWISLFYVAGSNNLYLVGPTRIIENSDTITLTHDGTDARITMSDGKLVVQTAEGTNTDTVFAVKGKGTGKGEIEIWDQSATNRILLQTADAIGGDVDFTLPSTDGNANDVMITDGSGGLSFAAQAAGGGVSSAFPGTLMNFLRSGTSAAPIYMYLTGGGGESVTMVNPATKTDQGWQAQVTNGAGNAARFGWNTGQNACGNLVDVYRLRGEYLTMGAWVYGTTADRVKLELGDGTTTTTSTSYHAGGGWEWMTVSLGATVAAGATAITAYVLIEAGAQITAYMELPCVVIGTSCLRHVGYHSSRELIWHGSWADPGISTQAITGCNFSPTAVWAWGEDGGDGKSFGSAVLRGATTTHQSAHGGATYSNRLGGITNKGFQTIYSWDSDGVTIQHQGASGAGCDYTYVIYGDNPV